MRWEPGSRARLAEAALALYGERGFEHTTVAEIAERAGVTERTFFRHFADKREVLFGGATALHDLLVEGVAAAAESATPIEVVAAALDAVGELFEGRRAHSIQRQRVIDANVDLRERELIKLATLAEALAEALRGRGVADPTARLTGEAAIAVFKVAFEDWVRDPADRPLAELIRGAFDALQGITAGDG